MHRTRLSLALAAAAIALVVLPSPSRAGEIPNALIVLEVAPGTPGSDPKAVAPPRLVLLEDGQVFVGGTGRLEAGKLEKPEQQALRRSADVVRKAAGGDGVFAFPGEGTRSVYLRLPEKDKPPITITGDPDAAAPDQAPVAAALAQMLRFDHPSLQPYKPASYALSAREERLSGGCRAWGFAVPLEQAAAAPVVVSGAEADGWPSGAWPASVCAGDKHYVVTLRPLLPGEQP